MLCQTTNNPVGCSTCLASLARPSSIRSGVEFSFNDYTLPSFCKHPRSMQYFFSGSSRAFLSSLFFMISDCIFNQISDFLLRNQQVNGTQNYEKLSIEFKYQAQEFVWLHKFQFQFQARYPNSPRYWYTTILFFGN